MQTEDGEAVFEELGLVALAANLAVKREWPWDSRGGLLSDLLGFLGGLLGFLDDQLGFHIRLHILFILFILYFHILLKISHLRYLKVTKSFSFQMDVRKRIAGAGV